MLSLLNKMTDITHTPNPLQAMKPLLAVLLLAFAPQATLAASPGVPGAGDILQQVAPLTFPARPASAPELTITRGDSGNLPPSAPFLVKLIRVTGNTLFATTTLHALVADAQGQSFTLPQLGELAARITNYYQSNGYPLARAIIPAQTIASGVVRIGIIEASYGKISLDNSSLVKHALLLATLAPLQSGQAIGQTDLDHALLLASDIPGVVVGATLKQGERVGTSDLLVSTTPGPTVTGNVMLDNFGNRYTGRARTAGTVNIINPLQHGDVLSLSGLRAGDHLNNARIGYETLLNGDGTRLGGAYSSLSYELGEPLAVLKANGTAQVNSLWAKHPLLRSRAVNLNGQLQFDNLQLRDRIDVSAIKTDRDLKNWTLSLTRDARDTLQSDSTTTGSLGFTAGRVSFQNEAAQLADAAAASTQGWFSKSNANVTRLHSLSAKNALFLTVSGQWANRNLDASQKMAIGGPYTVRAYDTGALSGDAGYMATAEWRHALGAYLGGSLQTVVFMDSGYVTVNRNPWVAGENSASLSGAGVGLSWTGPQQWRVRTYSATRVGSIPVLVASSATTRAWVELSRGF